jgi:hypothetical protein
VLISTRRKLCSAINIQCFATTLQQGLKQEKPKLQPQDLMVVQHARFPSPQGYLGKALLVTLPPAASS